MTNRVNDPWVYGQRADLAEALKQTGTDKREHAGLWFDKYIDRQQKKGISLGKDGESSYKTLVDQVHRIGVPEAYEHFFERWQHQIETMRVAIDECEYMVQCRYATAQGRIAIGLGDESVIETAVTLHHTYGVPYIPGSALKGMASAYAHRFLDGGGWRKKGDYHTALFGTTDAAGYVTFFDTLYVPGSGYQDKAGVPRALWPDVITVHHKEYYANQKDKAPADWDSPTPVPFLTATGTYLVALGGPLAWVELAFDLLSKALVEMGVGAKTSSGYGRMQLSKERPTAHGTSATQTQTSEQVTTQSEPQRQDRATPPPKPTAPPIPTVGKSFLGRVLKVDESAVLVEVPGFTEDKVIGVVKADNLAGKRFAKGNMARVEVTESRTLKNGRTVLELKPSARKEKSP